MNSTAPWILSLDVGTSSVRAQGYTATGQPIAHIVGRCHHAPVVTAAGGSDFAPSQLIQRCIHVLQQALAQCGALPPPVAVAVSTFWHSLVGIGTGGHAITPVYTWADTRSAQHVSVLLERITATQLHQETGCFAHTSYLPARLIWLQDTQALLTTQVQYWLSFADYLYLQLFGELGTSHSMASASGLYNQSRCQWSARMLAIVGITAQQLPPLVNRSTTLQGLRAPYNQLLPQLATVPWFPAYGDGACSNVGCGCATPDKVALMVGTSGAMRCVSAHPDYAPPSGLWCYRLDETRYVTGGALSNGGNALAWCKQIFCLPDAAALQEQLALLPPTQHGLNVLPFLAGERSTGWATEASAAIQGLRLHTTALDIYQAFMEAISLRFKAIYQQLEQHITATTIVATGGALLNSPVWLQMMADVLELPIAASDEPQASCRGAALLVAEQLGLVASVNDAAVLSTKSYLPRPQISRIYQKAFAQQIALYHQLIGQVP